MPAPHQLHRYLATVTRPDGTATTELFASLADLRVELGNRYRTGHGVRYGFRYHVSGTIDLNRVTVTDVKDKVTTHTQAFLFQVHKDGSVERNPRYKVVVGPRGGTYATRLKVVR